MEIKSRALLPILPELEENEETPEAVLIRQLEEYKVFKEIVGELKEQENVDRFYREPDKNVGKSVSVYKDTLTVEGFIEAFNKFLMKMEVKAQAENVSRAITKESFSVPQKIALIREILRTEKSFKFTDLFAENASKNEIVTTFIAMLELLKLQVIKVKQNGLFEEVVIMLNEENPEKLQNIDVAVGEEYESFE